MLAESNWIAFASVFETSSELFEGEYSGESPEVPAGASPVEAEEGNRESEDASLAERGRGVSLQMVAGVVDSEGSGVE